MEDAGKTITAINSLITTLVSIFGIGWTLIIIFATAVGTYFWKWYNNKRKQRYMDKLIEEKDKTIERMADEIRLMRIDFFKRNGWTDDDIDKYVN